MNWLLFAILTFVAILAYNIIHDYIRILARKKINHSKGAIIRGIFLIASIIFFIKASNGDLYFAIPGSIGMVLFHFWFWFDGILSTLRGYSWFFFGSDDEDDARTDNFLQGLKLWQHVAIKVGGMVAFTLLYWLTK